jgi:hypothetical protein
MSTHALNPSPESEDPNSVFLKKKDCPVNHKCPTLSRQNGQKEASLFSEKAPDKQISLEPRKRKYWPGDRGDRPDAVF